MRLNISALAVACVAPFASADLVDDGAFRWIVAEAKLVGSTGGREFIEDRQKMWGFYDHYLSAEIDRGSSGYTAGLGANTSDFTPTLLTAHGIGRAQAAMDGDSFSEALGGGISFATAYFHVDEPRVFRLSAEIIWSGSPDLCVVKLRESNFTEHFVLEASGSEGSATGVKDILLEPGKKYELFGIAAGVVELLSGPDAGELYSEFSFRFEPVPGPGTAAVLMLAGVSGCRRRR